MTAPPAPNKIHSLPVIVNYNLPSSSTSFAALLPSLQQVYVHPTSSSRDGGNDDICGSIYLKTVVQGVVAASPELHPLHPSSTDLTLYIFDPRETSLRRSRVSSTSLPSHLRPSSASSPISTPSSPALPAFNQSSAAAHDVWTGKGLVSWALDEPGLGKQLITGRLVKNASFASIPKEEGGGLEGLGGLAALMMADQEAWGIEISLSLKSGNSSTLGHNHAQAHHVVSRAARSSIGSASDLIAPSSPAASHSIHHVHTARPPLRPMSTVPTQAKPQIRPLSPTRRVQSSPAIKKAPVRRTASHAGRKKKNPDAPQAATGPSSNGAAAARGKAVSTQSARASETASQSGSQSSDGESFPGDIPAQLYSNPESLTKEQAERLLESPAFLSMLSKLTGQPIQAPETAATRKIRFSRKRQLEEQSRREAEQKAKKAKSGPGDGTAVAGPSTTKERRTPSKDESSTALKCWNCGRTKSAVWRTKTMEDGNAVRVCNACGLYWNKLRVMRPPSMWQGVDETPKTMPRRASTPADQPASRIDAAGTPAATPGGTVGGGLKRTLSLAVEHDAKRIAQSKTKPKNMLESSKLKPIPASSPVRAPAPKQNNSGLRAQPKQTAPASSPGWRSRATTPPPAESDNFDPVQNATNDTPNTAIRKMLTAMSAYGGQSLDASAQNNANSGSTANGQNDWNADISAFFDLEGFSLPQESNGQSQPHSGHQADPFDGFSGAPRSDAVQDVSRSDGPAEGSDDVISQLFNRTSSVGYESSPAPFDFSQLPPSSPPMMPSDLPHSALLLSSPDMSPWERKTSPAKSTVKTSYTPLPEADGSQRRNSLVEGVQHEKMARSYSDNGVNKGRAATVTTWNEKQRPQTSGLQAPFQQHQSTTPQQQAQAVASTGTGNQGSLDDMFAGRTFDELFGRMIEESQMHSQGHGQSQSQTQGHGAGQDHAPMQSSSTAAEGMLDDDIFSFLEKSMVTN